MYYTYNSIWNAIKSLIVFDVTLFYGWSTYENNMFYSFTIYLISSYFDDEIYLNIISSL